MQLFFWGNEIVLYERALKIAIFREIRQAIALPTVTESSIIAAQSPWLNGNKYFLVIAEFCYL